MEKFRRSCKKYNSRSPHRLYVGIALSLMAGISLAIRSQGAAWLPATLWSVNITTFLLFGWDKLIAGGTRTRVPERGLHVLCLLGGSPAGILARKMFRHKTLKPGFLRTARAIVILQFLVLSAGYYLYCRGILGEIFPTATWAPFWG